MTISFVLDCDLLLDSVGEGQIGLSSDHLSFPFGVEVGALRDISVDSGIEHVSHVENQSPTILKDSFACGEIHEENSFSDTLGSFLPSFIIGPYLNVPSLSEGKSGGLPEQPGIGCN